MADLKLGVDSSGAQKGFNDATTSANRFTASVQRAQKVVADFSSGLMTGARQAWQEHTKATQGAVAPTQQFTQQIQKSEDAVSRFANTLTRRFLTGLAVAQIRNLVSELGRLNEMLALTGDVANRTGTGVGSLQGIQGAARNKGVGDKSFLDAYSALNAEVEQARHGSGELLTLFRQTNSTLGSTEDAFFRISELITQATSQTAKLNILQAAGLPTTNQFLRLMEQGPAAIRAQAAEFSKFQADQLKAQQELNDKFNEVGGILERGFKRAVVAAYEFFTKAKEASDQYNASLTGQKRILTTGNESAGLDTSQTTGQVIAAFDNRKAAKDAAERAAWEKLLNQQTQQRISLLGDLATVDEQVKLKQAELNLADSAHVLLSGQARQAILDETRLKAEAAVASARLSLGLASENDIRKIAVASLPPAVRALGEHTEAVQKNTEAMAMQNQVAAAALPGLKQLELQSKDVRTQLDTLGQGLTSGITNPLVDLASGATKAGDAFKQMGLNVIRAIEQMIVNMTIAAPIARGLQSILGGFLPGAGIGWAGQPTQLGDATLVRNAVGGIFSGSGISSYSNTIVDKPTIFPFAKGIGLMGEAGAEAIMPLTRIGGKLGVLAEGGSGGDTYIDMSGMQIALPQDPNGHDPSGTIRSAAVAKAMESSVRNIVKDEMIRAQKPRGALNRASAI